MILLLALFVFVVVFGSIGSICKDAAGLARQDAAKRRAAAIKAGAWVK